MSTVISDSSVIGRPLKRFDGSEKVTGATQYVADLRLPHLAHARLVLSQHPHARIVRIETEQARRHPGVLAVISAADLPPLRANPGSRSDAVLARDEVFFVGQPIVAVVAETEAAAVDAAALVGVEYDLLPSVVDVVEATREASPLTRIGPLSPDAEEAAAHGAVTAEGEKAVKPRNVNTLARYHRGDVNQGFAAADAVAEEKYRLAPVHQGYLEPHGVIAAPERDGGIRIWTGTQGVFFVRNDVARLLGLPHHQVRVVPMAMGGGFGGKIVLLEPLVALLARHVRRPISLAYTRSEEFLAATPGHGAVIVLKMGARRDGTITACRARLYFDSGAFAGAPVGIAAILLGGSYRIENLDLESYEVLTHTLPGGAYRAPGAPQAFFALEVHMDALARRLDLDPLEFRLRNAARDGDPRPDGQTWPRLGLVECLERLRQHPLWSRRRTGPNEGFGIAIGGWGGGIEPAAATCRVNPDGSLAVQVGTVDISGTDTALAAIAAEAFGLPPAQVRIVHGDSDQAPYAGLSGGSKITYTVGPAVIKAAEDARRQVLAIAAEHLEANIDDLIIADGRVHVRGAPSRSVSVGQVATLSMQFGGQFIPVYGRGQTVIKNQSPIFGAHLAHVRLDPETGRVELLDYLAIHDVGRAINPPEVLGQVHGGVVQGIGRALYEQLAYSEDGQLLSTTFVDYLLPAAADIPNIQVELVEVPSAVGPYGAKGVGEPPCVPGAAAIANAIADAAGCRLTSVPLTPEVILRAISGKPAPFR